jgi:large subunit ribosomal protein L25
MARKELTVQPRELTGKKVAQLRRAGVLPANLYGHGVTSVSLQVSTEAFEHLLRAATANEVIDIRVSGERAARPVVIQHVQRHPLNSSILHADFYQVSLRERMRADVPLVFTGSSEAVDTYNGVLITSLEAVHVEGLPLDLPAHIEVDISPLRQIDDALHIRDLELPASISILNDPDVVVVKVARSSVAAEAAQIEAEERPAAPEEVPGVQAAEEARGEQEAQ